LSDPEESARSGPDRPSITAPARAVTIGDVAAEARVARSTVSRALNNPGRLNIQTQQHIQAVADRLGYHPNQSARALGTHRTQALALLLPNLSNQYFLGVFMRVQNEGDTSAQVPTDMSVVDTVGDSFKPLPSDSLFALKLGDTLHGGDELPEAESVAANGPIQGSMVLFRITTSAIQDRPLTLHITTSTGSAGEVELDL